MESLSNESAMATSPSTSPAPSETPSQQPHDISRRTIVILLILVTLLSALSTFSVLSEINKVKLMPTENREPATGKVQLTILDPNQPQPSTIATGKVTLEIKNK